MHASWPGFDKGGFVSRDVTEKVPGARQVEV